MRGLLLAKSASGAVLPRSSWRAAIFCSIDRTSATLRTASVTWAGVNGFGMYSVAPRRMASTAVSMEAYAVMTMIFSHGDEASKAGIRSRPLAVPSRRSTKARSKDRLELSETAS
jgi:hypothetical protein